MIYDILILGGGPAGYTAALYATRAGRRVAVVERMASGGQMCLTAQIDNYPGFPEGVDGNTLGGYFEAQARRFGGETVWGEIEKVDLASDPKRVTVDGSEYEARAIIIATGATHRHLDVEGEERLLGRGVGYCAACDGMLFRGKRVAVVGGGDSAVGDALILSELCEQVTLIHRRAEFRAARVLTEALKRKENITLCTESRVKTICGEKKVEAVELETPRGIERLALDGVFISVGREPATALFSGQLSLDEAGYVIAGEDTKASLPGVFAAGDVRTKTVRQVITAAADGAVAAHAAEEYLNAIDRG